MKVITRGSDPRNYYVDQHRVTERFRSEDPRSWIISPGRTARSIAWHTPVAVWLETQLEVVRILPRLPLVGISLLPNALTDPYPNGLIWRCLGWSEEHLGPYLMCSLGYDPGEPSEGSLEALVDGFAEEGHFIPKGTRYVVMDAETLQAVQVYYPKLVKTKPPTWARE